MEKPIFISQLISSAVPVYFILVSRGLQLVSLPLVRGVADLFFCSASFSVP
jgi:hypothetical protein